MSAKEGRCQGKEAQVAGDLGLWRLAIKSAEGINSIMGLTVATRYIVG